MLGSRAHGQGDKDCSVVAVCFRMWGRFREEEKQAARMCLVRVGFHPSNWDFSEMVAEPGYAPFASAPEHLSPHRDAEVGSSQPPCGGIRWEATACGPSVQITQTWSLHFAYILLAIPRNPITAPLSFRLQMNT